MARQPILMVMIRAGLRSHPAQLLAVALLYFGLGHAALAFPRVAGEITLFWPPAGVGLAAVLLGGRRFWPAISVGVVAITLLDRAPPLLIVLTAIADPLEAIAGAWLLRRYTQAERPLGRVSDVVALLVASLVIPTISASAGVLSLVLSGVVSPAEVPAAWIGWWASNAVGIMLVTPTAWTWHANPRLSLKRSRVVEALGLTALIALVSTLIYGQLLPTNSKEHLAYLTFPLLVWAALRFDTRGAATALLAVGATAVLGTAFGTGPFASGNAVHRVFHIYTFVGIATATCLVMAAIAAERRDQDNAARDREERLRLMVQQAPALLWTTDSDLRLTSVVGKGLERFGIDSASVIGMTIEKFHEDSPADAARHTEAHRNALLGRSAAYDTEWHGRSLRLHVEPLRDSDDRITGCIGMVLDVTRQRAIERARLRSELRYRELFEYAPVGIFRATPDGRFEAVNPALVQMLGYSSVEELMAVDIATDLYGDRDRRRQYIESYAGMERYSDVPLEWRRKDGSAISLRVTGRALRDERGDFAGFENIVEDVTGQRELEEQLRQAQKMESLGILTGGMAHDFNNLLTTVLANAELVADELPPAADTARAELEEIRRSARRGAELIRKLLAFSRRERLEPRPIDLGATVTELAATLTRLLPETIRIEWSVEPDLPLITADPGAVQQVVLNLATNARDAMPNGGTLSIQLVAARLDETARRRTDSPPDRYLRLSVTDTGLGMDEATKARAFEPFFTTKAPGQGSGLGLAMVYGLVRQQNGLVRLYSEPAKGTTIKLYWPVSDGSASHLEAIEPAVGNAGSETILVVEDEAPIRRVTERVLKKHGYRVLVAEDGVDGLARFREHEQEIDLVLTDVVMPRMGGPALAQALCKEGKCVPVLFSSGYTERDPQVAGTLEPDAPFISKPWAAKDLLAKIRQVLDS